MERYLVILIVSLQFSVVYGQDFTTSQTFGTTGTCIGCEVQNPSFSVDSDSDTYALLNLTVSTAGSAVYQDLIFTSAATDGGFIGVIVEADNLIEITEEIIAGLMLTSFIKRKYY